MCILVWLCSIAELNYMRNHELCLLGSVVRNTGSSLGRFSHSTEDSTWPFLTPQASSYAVLTVYEGQDCIIVLAKGAKSKQDSSVNSE
jgi:hypothetical protein